MSIYEWKAEGQDASKDVGTFVMQQPIGLTPTRPRANRWEINNSRL
jgi:hypothetical protein